MTRVLDLKERILREHQFSNGKYVDSYVLGLLRSDWKKMKFDDKKIKMWSQLGQRAALA